MNKTSIEWVRNPDGSQGFTCNIVVGCSHIGCAVWPKCFAYHQSKRQKHRCERCYIFTPHIHWERLKQISTRKKPSGILVDSMGDLFDGGILREDQDIVLANLEQTPQHRFYVKTKQAQVLPSFFWPPNIWLMVSVNLKADLWRIEKLKQTNAKVKGVSFEPLYEDVSEGVNWAECLEGIDWIIIGGETCNGRVTWRPDTEDVACLTIEARHQGCKVFMKNNLQTQPLIQEFPKP